MSYSGQSFKKKVQSVREVTLIERLQLVEWKTHTNINSAAANERFGARGAVVPQKILCGIERLSPA